MKISNNEKGNKMHADDGKFTGPGDSGGKTSKKQFSKNISGSKDDDKPDFKPFSFFSGSSPIAFIKEKKENASKYANEIMSKIGPALSEDIFSQLKSMPIEDKKSFLSNSSSEYDEKILKSLTPEQIDALMYCESVMGLHNNLLQQIKIKGDEIIKIESETAAKRKELLNLYKQKEDEILISNGISGVDVSGIWYNKNPVISDYPSLINSIQAKKDYYNKIIQNEFGFDMPEDIAKAKSMLDKLEKYEEYGKKYSELSSSIKAERDEALKELDENRLSEISKISDDIFNLKEKLVQFNNVNDPVRNVAVSYMVLFQNKSAMFSQFRKNNAIWIRNGKTIPGYEQMGVIKDEMAASKIIYYNEMFAPIINHLSNDEFQIIQQYTGNGYSRFNKPLRGKKHPGWSGWNFSHYVTRLTNFLNRCFTTKDVWVNRRTGDIDGIKILGSNTVTSLMSLNESQLPTLVGSMFKDNGFVSSSVSSEYGYGNDNIRMNIYMPKGTNACYVEPISSIHDENEMIIQRGYTYRITKVEKKKERLYIDCELIPGSNKDMVTDMNKLKEIGDKYLV